MRKKISILIFICLISFSVLFIPNITKAANPVDFGSCTDIFYVINQINKNAASGQITGAWDVFGNAECITWAAINFLLIAGTTVAGFLVALSGIKYISAMGNSTKQQAAIKSLNSAVIGLALLLISWSAFSFFINFMEYNIYVDNAKKFEIKIENPNNP